MTREWYKVRRVWGEAYEENQELTIDYWAVSVENLGWKPNWQLERML